MDIVPLRKRQSFVKLRHEGRSFVCRFFIMQVTSREKLTETKGLDSPLCDTLLGITASKKIGGAVVRNFAKRRIRSLAREHLPLHGQPGMAYHVVVRYPLPSGSFSDLSDLFKKSLTYLHKPSQKRDQETS